MPTGEEIGKDYPTLMPALTDEANIQEAFTMYHYGLTSYTGVETISASSIEGHFGDLDTRITDLEERPVGGGEVNDSEPADVGGNPIPDGYIWVDGDSSGLFDYDIPNIILSTTDPSASLTMSDAGTIWIDTDSTADVLNVSDYALVSPSANQTLTNTTLTSPVINSASVVGGTGEAIVLTSPEEKVTVSASAASASVQYDLATQSILYYSASATGDWTVNFRGDSSTTLNSILNTGESITAVFLVTQGATAYYQTALQIDGSSVTPKWQGGSAPTAGNADSIDAYTATIIKTGDAAFTVLESQTRFA